MRIQKSIGRRTLAVAAVVAAVGVFGLVHATLGLYQTPGSQYKGHWVWNDPATDTAQVDVRVQAIAPCCREKTPVTAQSCIRNFRIEVTGVASDLSSETKTALLQVPAGFIREAHVSFDHQLTQLTFIKILSVGNSTSCNCPS